MVDQYILAAFYLLQFSEDNSAKRIATNNGIVSWGIHPAYTHTHPSVYTYIKHS